MNTILPNILEVAQEHGLDLYRGPREEKRADCPFCPGGDSGLHLYLNAAKNIFHCFKCGAKGGVVQFIALSEGRYEADVLEDLKERARKDGKYRPRKPDHPVKALHTYQLEQAGLVLAPDWKRKENNPAVLEWMWGVWQAHLEYELYSACRYLILSLADGCYREGLELVKGMGKKLGVDLLTPVLKALSSPNPPA